MLFKEVEKKIGREDSERGHNNEKLDSQCQKIK